jgi:hypothetical protein
VIDIIACLSASSSSSNAIFFTPAADKRDSVMENRRHFRSAYGDHITLLQTFREYLSVLNSGKYGEGVKEWCARWDINRVIMKNVVVCLPLNSDVRKSRNNSFRTVRGSISLSLQLSTLTRMPF